MRSLGAYLIHPQAIARFLSTLPEELLP